MVLVVSKLVGGDFGRRLSVMDAAGGVFERTPEGVGCGQSRGAGFRILAGVTGAWEKKPWSRETAEVEAVQGSGRLRGNGG